MKSIEAFMDYIKISINKTKELKSLHSKKGRDKLRLFLAEGTKCISDLLGYFELSSLVCTPGWIEHHTRVQEFSNKILIDTGGKAIRQISSLSTPPEAIATFKIPESDVSIPQLKPDDLYVLLEDIQDPGNLGTIIRTCDWFGIYNIYASPATVDVFNPKVVQATMGSLSRVKVMYLDLEDLIKANRNVTLYGTLLMGTPLCEVNKNSGMLLMGNEGKGISESLKKYIDTSVTIPPFNSKKHPDSLNVAIASAIIISHFRNS